MRLNLKASSLTGLETILLFCVFCKSTKEARRTGSWFLNGKIHGASWPVARSYQHIKKATWIKHDQVMSKSPWTSWSRMPPLAKLACIFLNWWPIKKINYFLRATPGKLIFFWDFYTWIPLNLFLKTSHAHTCPRNTLFFTLKPGLKLVKRVLLCLGSVQLAVWV